MTYLEYIKCSSSVDAMKELIKNGYVVNLDEVYNANAKYILGEISNENFQNIYKHIPSQLNRRIVFEAYSESLYKGFVYSMLWGGIGSYSMNQATIAFSIPQSDIVTKLKRVSELLNKDKIKEAFESMNEGENKIDQIGLSYFTKILYFMYTGKSDVRPLILDKWGKFIHAGLITGYNSYTFTLNKYRIGYDKKHTFYVSERGRKCKLTDLYMDYLNIMSNLSKELKFDNPDILEEYLFGKDLKRRANKNDSNPRFFLKSYLMTLYEGFHKNESAKSKKNENEKEKLVDKEKNKQTIKVIPDHQQAYNTLVRRGLDYRIFGSEEKIPDRKVYFGCEIEDGLKLYVGKNYKGEFCSIYKKEGIAQDIIDRFNEILPDKWKNRDWIARYCNYDEAVRTLNQVLDRLQEKDD